MPLCRIASEHGGVRPKWIARFQVAVQGGVFQRCGAVAPDGIGNRTHLGMRTAIFRVPSLAHQHSVAADDHGSDQGIRMDVTAPASGK